MGIVSSYIWQQLLGHKQEDVLARKSVKRE